MNQTFLVIRAVKGTQQTPIYAGPGNRRDWTEHLPQRNPVGEYEFTEFILPSREEALFVTATSYSFTGKGKPQPLYDGTGGFAVPSREFGRAIIEQIVDTFNAQIGKAQRAQRQTDAEIDGR